MNIMQLAHKNANFGFKKFGGNKSDYFIESLKLAHKGIDLQALEAEKVKEEKANNNKTFLFCLFIMAFTFSVLFVISGEPENVQFASIKTALNAFGCLAVYNLTKSHIKKIS